LGFSTQKIYLFFLQGEQVEFLKPLEDIETKEKTKVEMNVETSEETSDQVVSWFKVSSISIRFIFLFVLYVCLFCVFVCEFVCLFLFVEFLLLSFSEPH
jgi:hypothetical protein